MQQSSAPDGQKNTLNYARRLTKSVLIGDVPLGSEHPLRIQTMANVSTNEVKRCVEQTLRVQAVGCDYMRFTAQGVREASALGAIRETLRGKGCTIPLVADIHFNPQAAYEALKHVEKVRINPGNFADKKGERSLYETDQAWYEAGAQRVKELFGTFVRQAQSLGRTLRLGINHGSLSERMLHRWGNTPEGMVESCWEYLSVAQDCGFDRIVISMKSSNVQVMTQAVRLLVARLDAHGWNFPLHLGVTEAGEGEDGRIKSAVGIGSLLLDGIGDTLRVSLSEEPEAELPVAQRLVAHIADRAKAPQLSYAGKLCYKPWMLPRQESSCVAALIGGGQLPKVWVYGQQENSSSALIEGDLLRPYTRLHEEEQVFKGQKILLKHYDAARLSQKDVDKLNEEQPTVAILHASGGNAVGAWRRAIALLTENQCHVPIMLHRVFQEETLEEIQLIASADLGLLLLEGVASGIVLSSPHHRVADLYAVGLGILQATRLRFSHTEFISCPGCGRTLFDLAGTIARVKQATAHLPNLKIGIMGCIVNGPGEMADADYGYVGGAPGKIDLYKGQECQMRGIPEENAVEALIDLIRTHGDWIEKEE